MTRPQFNWHLCEYVKYPLQDRGVTPCHKSRCGQKVVHEISLILSLIYCSVFWWINNTFSKAGFFEHFCHYFFFHFVWFYYQVFHNDWNVVWVEYIGIKLIMGAGVDVLFSKVVDFTLTNRVGTWVLGQVGMQAKQVWSFQHSLSRKCVHC